MTLGGITALAGLFLAGWAYQANDGRTFTWAVVMIIGAPLVRALIGSPGRTRTGAVAAATEETAPQASQADAEVAAKIAQFNAAKQAHYEKHVKR